MMKWRYTLDTVEQIAQQLKIMTYQYQIFTLQGPLGVGKTTLMQKLFRACGVQQSVTSPTFSYLSIYETDDNRLIYHFDLYRIPSMEQFVKAGFDEYLYQQNSFACIEWPECIMPLLNRSVCYITIEFDTIDARTLYIETKNG